MHQYIDSIPGILFAMLSHNILFSNCHWILILLWKYDRMVTMIKLLIYIQNINFSLNARQEKITTRKEHETNTGGKEGYARQEKNLAETCITL